MTTCPGYWEVRSDYVASSFDMDKFVGEYYEQALHDYTQYPTCPSLSCIRSHKEWTDVLGGDFQIKDTFSLRCFGDEFVTPYYFNTTGHNGFLMGFLDDPPMWWRALFGDKIYPNTIVDVKESSDNGQYEWAIEFQCRDTEEKGIGFTGFNFYTREQEPGQDVVDEMIQAARDAGLGIYMDQNFGIHYVNQSQSLCNYENSQRIGAGAGWYTAEETQKVVAEEQEDVSSYPILTVIPGALN